MNKIKTGMKMLCLAAVLGATVWAAADCTTQYFECASSAPNTYGAQKACLDAYDACVKNQYAE